MQHNLHEITGVSEVNITQLWKVLPDMTSLTFV